MQQPLNIVPDFSEATSFSAFPNGTFKCRVVNVEHKKSQAGNDMLNWQFEIVENSEYVDPADGSTQNRKGRRLFRNTPTTGKGAGFLKEVLVGIGVKPTEFRFPASVPQVKGRLVFVTTISDSYNGVTRNQPSSFKLAPQN